MIFSNQGITQISGDAFHNALELSQILRTIRKRAIESGETKEVGDNVIVFAGRLSMVPDAEEKAFVESLPQRQMHMDEIIDLFNERYGQ